MLIYKSITSHLILVLLAITTSHSLVAHFINLESESQYNTLMQSKKPLVLQFSAPWCGACMQAKQPIEEVAQESEFNDITIIRINTDTFGSLATTHAIRGIPTYIFFNNGEKVTTMVGLSGRDIKESFRTALRQHLLNRTTDTHATSNTSSPYKTSELPVNQDSFLGTIHTMILSIIASVSTFFDAILRTVTGKSPRS